MRFLVGGVVIGLWAWTTGRFAGLRMERSEWRPLIFLARAVQRFDPVKLLLSQVLNGHLRRGLARLRALADSLDGQPRHLDRLSGRPGRGLQLCGEPLAPAPLPAERARGVLPHPAD